VAGSCSNPDACRSGSDHSMVRLASVPATPRARISRIFGGTDRMLYEAERHEPLTASAWDEQAARACIDEILGDAKRTPLMPPADRALCSPSLENDSSRRRSMARRHCAALILSST
jgi:hypothetical protein